MIKKIMISILMIIGVFVFTNQTIRASFSTDTSDSYKENLTLCNGSLGSYCDTATDGSDYLFNEQIVTSYEDLTLTEGETAEVTFELANVLSHAIPANGYEVSTIQMKINMGTHYQSDNVVYTTNETELRKEVAIYPVGDTTENYEATQFILDIDPEGYENIVNYVADFSFSSNGNIETGSTRIGTTLIIIEYTRTSDSYSDVINVNTDYSRLPDTDKVFKDIISINEYNNSTHSFKMTYSMNDIIYSFNVSIPEDMYTHVYSSSYIDEVHFEDIPASQMSIGTSAEGENIIYIQPDFSKSNKPAILEDGAEPDIVGFATINLTNMEYKIINKLELMGVVNKEDHRYASLYAFFPVQIESLLSITVEYEYRINSILGIKGEWKDTMNTYVRGEQYDGEPPTWLWWIPGGGWGWAATSYITGDYDIYDIPNVIVPIDSDDVPGEVEYKYVNELGGDSSDLEELELYKISLGQYQNGFFTAFSDDNAYDIEELVILEIIYEYKGVVYEASTDEIDSNVSTPDLSPGLIDPNSESTKIIVYVITGIVFIYLFTAFRLDKKPGLVLLLALGGLYLLYTMGVIF